MPPTASGTIEDLVAGAITEGVFPGAVVHVRLHGEVICHRAFGDCQTVPERRAMREDLVFDLASLTKPLATATAILRLWERGRVDLDQPVSAYLPGCASLGKAGVTVRHLLTHTAGLPAWIRLYLHTRSPAEAVGYFCGLPPVAPPGTRVEYSDLGYILLGEVVALAGGVPLDRYVADEIAPILGWRWTRFRPPLAWRDRCVPTEVGNAYERTAAGTEGAGFQWREGLIVGEVHDGNSHYVFQGVAGHAGLFGTADEVGRFAQAMLDGGQVGGKRLLQSATVAAALRDHTREVTGDGRGLGWKLRRGSRFMGERASPAAFGHTGFTGTSILIDPERVLAVVLLANRVHPHAAPSSAAIDEFRRTLHDALITAVEGSS